MSTPLGPDDPRHGTPNGYKNRGCRCAPCRDAWRQAMQDYRDRRYGPAAPRPYSGCGTYAGLVAHNHRHERPCQDCRDAAAIYHRQLRRRKELGLPIRTTQARTIRADLADLPTVGAVLDAAWRWNA